MDSKIEFAVQMECEACVRSVSKKLEGEKGIRKYEVDLISGSVLVETSLSTASVLEMLQSTGRKAVVKGHGGSMAAVAILDCGNDNVKGIIRFTQISKNSCIIDGTVDGLAPGPHFMDIHEHGDLSDGCFTVGEVYIPKGFSPGVDKLNPSKLVKVDVEKNGRADFRVQHSIKLSDLIGRSIVVKQPKEKKIVCGIIALSSGLFENPKMICACSGISIWDERKKPEPAV